MEHSAEIFMAQARAAELQAKIDVALQRAYYDDEGRHGSLHPVPDTQNLRAIRTALLQLHGQLDSLQALEKRQKFEKEEVLVELEERRNLLIKRLREYKGTEWEIVEEAYAFVGVPMQREDDLVLPPYQSGTRDAHVLGKGHKSGGLSRHRQSRPLAEADKKKQSQVVLTSDKNTSNSTGSFGFVFILSKLASRTGKVVLLSTKSAFVIASIMFTLSRLELQLRQRSTHRVPNKGFRVYSSASRSNRPSSASTSNGHVIQEEFCPPGKVLLVKDGIRKCFVKERTETLFQEVIKQPDVTYGCG